MGESIHSDFAAEISAGLAICVMPVPRLRLGAACRDIAGCTLYPPEAIDLDELRIVSHPAYEFAEVQRRGYGDLAWYQSGATLIEPSDYDASTLIAVAVAIDFNRLFEGSHDDHKALLTEVSERFEQAMDLVRFDYCRLDLPQTLPGRVGMLDDGGAYSTGLFYSGQDHESYIIGAELMTHRIVGGLGLELDHDIGPLNIGHGEAGNIARRGLALLTTAMEANTLTGKFTQAFFALEFLASPGEYEKMKDVKTQIASHVARSKTEYLEVCDDFRRLTSFKDDGIQTGVRTNLAHMGERFEVLVPDLAAQRAMFQRLQRYICATIAQLIEQSDSSWAAVRDFRRRRRAELGIE